MSEKQLVLGEWTGRYNREGRKIYKNNLGGGSSEYTIGVKNSKINGGKLTHIPSIYNGKIVDQEEAERIIIQNKGRDPETKRLIAPGGDPEARSNSLEDKAMTELNPEMIVKAMQDISDPDMQAAKEMQEEDKAAGVDRPIEYYKMIVSQEKVATEAEFGGAEEDPEGFIDSIKSYFSDEDKKSEDPESYDEDKAIEKILAENYEDFYQTSNDEGGFYDSGTPEDTARKQASQLYEGLQNGQAGYLQGASQQFNNADPGLANQQINQGELAMQQGPGVTGAQVVQPPTQQGISATSGLSQQQIMEALQRFQQPEQPNPMAQDQQLRQMALQGIQGNGIQGGGITPEMLSRFQSNIGITHPGTYQ